MQFFKCNSLNAIIFTVIFLTYICLDHTHAQSHAELVSPRDLTNIQTELISNNQHWKILESHIFTHNKFAENRPSADFCFYIHCLFCIELWIAHKPNDTLKNDTYYVLASMRFSINNRVRWLGVRRMAYGIWYCIV